MTKFKLPPISPLLGARLSVVFKLWIGRKIDKKNYLKISLTLVVLLIATLFHWIDRLYFKIQLSDSWQEKPPLFIVGHWRSGTTLLHNLLSHDPELGYVTTYHAVFPNNLKSKWLWGTFMKIFMPNERPGDQLKLDIEFPQEDEYAMSNLTHMAYYHSFYFPKHYQSYYNKWVRFKAISEMEMNKWKSIYRRMVQLAMINTHGQRAVLKNPANTGRIDKLLELWPDAQFIFLIRNPIIVYLSSKKFFTQLYPTLELEAISQAEIRKMILDVYSTLLKDYLRLKALIPADNLVEIRYEDLKQHPRETLEYIYNKFHLNNLDVLKSDFDRYLSTQKNHKMHQYSIERAELELISGKLDFAMKHWHYTIPENLAVVDDEKINSINTKSV